MPRFDISLEPLIKLIGILVIVPVLFFAAFAQDETPRQRVLASKGNLEVSKLFRETPALPLDDKNAEIYRITFLPTFNNPIKIRVEKRKNAIRLTAKQLSGQGGYDPGKLKIEKNRIVSTRQWNRLLTLLGTANFWKLDLLEKETGPNEKGEVTICLDGSEWVIEGVKNGEYHVVNRYCPEIKSFQAVGEYLLKLSRLNVKRRNLY